MDLSLLCLVVWGRFLLFSVRFSTQRDKMADLLAFMKNYYLFIAFAMVENLSSDAGALRNHAEHWLSSC